MSSSFHVFPTRPLLIGIMRFSSLTKTSVFRKLAGRHFSSKSRKVPLRGKLMTTYFKDKGKPNLTVHSSYNSVVLHDAFACY